MRFISTLLSLMWLATSCSVVSQLNHVKGVLIDNSNISATIVTEADDTLTFNIPPSLANQTGRMSFHDTVEFYFAGGYKPGVQAKKMTVQPKKDLIGGDKDEHGCLKSAGYIWSEVQNDCIRLFEKGIRLTAVDKNPRAAFIVFSPDSIRAEIFFSDDTSTQILHRNKLSSGEYVWDADDIDTDLTHNNPETLRSINGNWNIYKGGKLIYTENREATSQGLGNMQQLTYEGLLPSASGSGIEYRLTINTRKHSGDGTFDLTLTYKDEDNVKGNKLIYSGKRFTQRGIPGDNNATVWQCVSNSGNQTFNFLRANDTTLLLLDQDFKKPESELNYILNLVTSPRNPY